MANDETIAALKAAAKMLSDEASSVECASHHEHSRKAAAKMEADAILIYAHIETLRNATRTGDRAVTISWSTAVEAKYAMQARWDRGDYGQLMADDRSFAAFALSELKRVVETTASGAHLPGKGE